MSTLANLTNEECELLVEVLEAEQKALQTQRADPQTRLRPATNRTARNSSNDCCGMRGWGVGRRHRTTRN